MSKDQSQQIADLPKNSLFRCRHIIESGRERIRTAEGGVNADRNFLSFSTHVYGRTRKKNRLTFILWLTRKYRIFFWKGCP